MLTSATGRRSRSDGFTLVEVLIVLAIVALLAGLAMFNYSPSPVRQLQSEAATMTARLNFALDEAVMRGGQLGFALEADGYRFFAFDPADQEWQELALRPLARHVFETPLGAELALLDANLDRAARERLKQSRDRGTGNTDAGKPEIVLFESGELTPFRITLTLADGTRATIETDGFTAVAWELDDGA